jgi:GWxTD domain-containing protein
MNQLRSLLIGLLFLSALPLLRAQEDQPPPVQALDLPRFFLDALAFAGDQAGTGRVDVYLDVPYKELRFTSQGDVFEANYEVSLIVADSLGKSVTEKWWKDKVETPDYNTTVSSYEGRLAQRSFTLPPGPYTIRAEVTDVETRKTWRVQRDVRVRDFSRAPLELSDIMLVSSLKTEGEKKVVSPNISGTIGDGKDGFHILFEAYNTPLLDSARVVVRLLNAKGKETWADTSMEALGVAKKSCFRLVKTTELPSGTYDVVVELDGRKPGATATEHRAFIIRWEGMPMTVVDLDLAVEQMQYVADKDKLDEMKEAHPDRKRDLFSEFWKKKDPTPTTERNELMEEYYNRVEYANKHFSHYVEGWRSDMGMVYIIFGSPSNIERHPFDIDAKPYEVWTYYEQDRQFTFVDQSGFGDYRLLNPIWDIQRTRPR